MFEEQYIEINEDNVKKAIWEACLFNLSLVIYIFYFMMFMK